MMSVYLGDACRSRATPIHAEIQATGWLLDGGIPMWLLYGGAVVMALVGRLSILCETGACRIWPRSRIVVLGVQALIAGFAWAGPAFNTQLGSQFWFFTSALYGASRGVYGTTAWRK